MRCRSGGCSERWRAKEWKATLHHPERRTRCPAWEKILKRLKKAKLLEAEGLALTGAGARKAADFAIERPDGEVQMLVVKAISDYGDHDKDDQFRTYAAQASAWFLLDLLRRHWAAVVPGKPGAAPSS